MRLSLQNQGTLFVIIVLVILSFLIAQHIQVPQRVSRTQTDQGSTERVDGSIDTAPLVLKVQQFKDDAILQRELRLDTAQTIGASRYKQLRHVVRDALEDVDATSLGRLSGEEVYEIYHRYVNTLQFFCPLKDMLGGVGWGWYICQGFSKNGGCLIYLITDKKDEDKFFTHDVDQVYKCQRNHIQTGAIKEELKRSEADTPVMDELAQKERVDILLIDDDGSGDIVSGLLRRGALRHVDQLSVVFKAVNNNTSVTKYATQILRLKALHKEGFRIFQFERNPSLVFTPNPWRTGGYTLNMMRERGVDDPMVIPKPDQMAAMTVDQLASTYHSFLLTTEVLCREILRVGDIDDGGWDVCVDDKYRPVSPCLVYSFGIKDDWTFDERISSRFGCEVHSFDPSIGLLDHRRSQLQWFHNLGLSNKRGTIQRKSMKWNMMDLKSIRTSLGHTNRQIDILKMDIEQSEWVAIPNMIKTGVLTDVKQLYVEVHFAPNRKSVDYFVNSLTVLRELHDLGFRLYWSHPNQVRYNLGASKYTNRQVSSCYELYYVNINL